MSRTRRRAPRPPWRRGSVLLYAAFVTLPVLVGVAGLAVDVGRVQLVRMELQQAADAASRHGAGGVMQGRSTALDRAVSSATDPAVTVDGQPLVAADLTCEYGNWNPRLGAFTAQSATAFGGNAVRVTATRTVALSFMTVLNQPTATVRATSTSCLPGALFVVENATSPVNDDLQAANRIWYGGLSVEFVTPEGVTAADAPGHAVVVVSETISSGTLGAKLRDVPVPVVCYEGFVFDDFAMSGTASTDYGKTNSGSELRLRASMGALFGVPDNTPLQVQNTASSSGQFFAKVGPAATVVMRQVNDASRASVFYYEKGAAMVGRTAPHRRVGLWIYEFNRLNDLGRDIFDGAVKFAVGGDRAVVTVQ